LDHLFLGPYEIIEKVNDEAWRLKLGPGMEKLHPVFHSSLLEPYQENTIPGRTIPPPPPVELAQDIEYEVNEIVDSKILRKALLYRVKWKGYGIEEDSWEPKENVEHAPHLVKAFHDKYPKKPSGKDIKIPRSSKGKGKRQVEDV
jgi:hypothetical protein